MPPRRSQQACAPSSTAINAATATEPHRKRPRTCFVPSTSALPSANVSGQMPEQPPSLLTANMMDQLVSRVVQEVTKYLSPAECNEGAVPATGESAESGGLAAAIVHLASLLELKTNCCSRAFEHHPISWLSCSGMVFLDTIWFLRAFSNLPLYIWDGFSVLKYWIEEITQAFFSEIWHHQDKTFWQHLWKQTCVYDEPLVD